MGTNRIETQVSRDLYGHGAAGPGLDYPRPRNHRQTVVTTPGVAAGGYRESLPPQPYPKSKGSVDYFQGRRPSSPTHLNFIEQLAGFELTSKETFVLGGLFVLASPMLAVGILAGCERDLIPKAPSREEPPEDLCGGEKCDLPNAISACIEDQCRIDRCVEGFSNANGLDEDGCECREAEGGCNHPPELETIEDKTVNEGEELRFRVEATDPDRDELQFFAESLPGGASFSRETQFFNWTPNFEQAGIYEGVRFMAKDSGNLLDEEVVSITVSDVNRPPSLAEIGNKTVDEGELLEFVVSAVDPDRDNLTYSAEGLPAGANLNPATGRFAWTPSFQQAGEYRVLFTVTDDRVPNLSDSRNVVITVNDVNRRPVIDPIPNRTINENQLLTVAVSASDPDGDALTFSGENLPNGAMVDPTTGTLTWTPAFDQAGVYPNVGITATDGDLSVTQRFSITVNNMNRAPVMDPIPNRTARENQLLTVAVSASDPDGDSLAFSGENLPNGAIVNPTTGTLTWTPTSEQAGAYTNVGITATDGNLSDTQRFSITVTDINRAPVMDPIANQTVRENQLLMVNVIASDPDGDALAFTGDNLPMGATVNLRTGLLTWTPTFEQAGVYPNVGITATDGDLSVTRRFSITANDVNRAPTLDPIPDQTVNENQLLTINVRASDPDGDVLTFSGENLPAGAMINPTTGTLSWTPTFDQAGVYPNVGITVTDGDLSVTRRFSITANNVNRRPVMDPILDQTVGVGRLLTVAVNASDPDGDALTYMGDNLPAGAAVDRQTGTLTWTPTFAQAGVHTNVGIIALDGLLGITQQFDITVTENRAPVMDPIGNQVAEAGIPLAFTLSGSDPDGDTLTYSAVGLPTGSTLDANTGQFNWTPTVAQIGNHEITFRVSDGDLTDSEAINVEVRGVREVLESRITNAAVLAVVPSLVWTGNEYGVSWHDGRNGNWEIYFARIDTSGNKIGGDVRIAFEANSSIAPSLVWAGTEYGVSWEDSRNGSEEIYFARIDASGNKIGGDVRITNAGGLSLSPSLVWTGSEYGVSWTDERDGPREIYFARISASGNKIGEDARITNAAGNFGAPSLVWTESEYGVSWASPLVAIYFARIDGSGNKIGGDVRITDDAASSRYPSLVWTGSTYGVSWEDQRDGNWEIYFARIDASGNKTGGDVRITSGAAGSYSPSLVWTGTEYGVSWVAGRDGNSEIYFARIDASGNKIGQDVRVTNAAANSGAPSLVWTGMEYGVSWNDNRDGNNEIYFARIIGNFTPTP